MSEDIRVEFVGGTDIDPAEIDALTMALREEILQVDEVDRVEQASEGPAPEGSKALDLAAIGALIVGIIRPLSLDAPARDDDRRQEHHPAAGQGPAGRPGRRLRRRRHERELGRAPGSRRPG
jgi:hypothetical protein